MALTGNYTKQLGLDSSDTTTLVNVAGQTATLTEGSLYFAGAGTTFENQAGAVFEKTTTNTAYIQGSGLFDNAGTLSVKDGTLYLYSQFSNTGLVDVQSGS